MENAIENALLDLNDWWDICSIKAEIGVYPLKLDIYDIMAMMHSLRELDLLRAGEVEMEM